jgi:hypothetical protein
MYIRPRFFSEIGAAIVVLAALCALASSVASISAYLHEYGSWCGTVRREIQSNVGLWVSTLSVISVSGFGLASLHRVCPRVCRLGVIVTFLVSIITVIVMGLF